MKLGRLLRECRETAGLTQQEVAAKLGITQSYLSHLETSRSILNRTHILRRVAELFKLDYHYIKGLSEQDEVEFNKLSMLEKYRAIDHSAIPPQASKKKRYHIPILNEIPADIPNDMTDFDFPPGIAEDYVDRYLDNFTTTDPSTYAVRVGADCMEPKLEKGDNVLLSKTKEWESGDIVAVRWSDGEKKELRRIIKQDDHIILQPENPKYSPIVLNKEDKPEVMGVFTMLIRIPRK